MPQTATRPIAARWSSLLLAATIALATIALGGCSVLGVRVLPEPEPPAVPAAAQVPAPSAPTPQSSDEVPEPAASEDAVESAAVPLTQATVVRVVDGDTAVFKLKNGKTEKTRFIGIDTPESTNSIEEYGREAAAFTKQTLHKGRTVYLELGLEKRDRYGRLLAYVWLSPPHDDGKSEVRHKMFNAKLALGGYAQQMTIQPNSKYADYFRDFVAEARNNDAGLWGTEPDAPERESAAPAPAPTSGSSSGYVCNSNTGKFHHANCSSVDDMSEKNKVPMDTREQAVGAGYVPCKRCNP